MKVETHVDVEGNIVQNRSNQSTKNVGLDVFFETWILLLADSGGLRLVIGLFFRRVYI